MARSADGFLNAVTGATALSRGDLGPAAANANLVGADYFSADAAGTPPAPTRGDSGQFHNAIVEEFQYILDLGSINSPSGLAMDPTDNSQLSQVLKGVTGITADVSSTGYVTNVNTRVVIGSEGSRAAGDGTAVIASKGDGEGLVSASGSQSAVVATTVDDVASNTAGVTGYHSLMAACHVDEGDLTVSGNTSATLASYITNGHGLQNSGTRCLIGASRSDTTGSGIITGAEQCVSLANTDPQLYAAFNSLLLGTELSTITAGAFRCAVLASRNSEAGGQDSAIIASEYCETEGSSTSAFLGCKGGSGHIFKITGNNSVAVGCSGSDTYEMDGDNQVILASGDGVDAPAAAYQVFGGVSSRTWRIDSQNGGFYASGTPSGSAAQTGTAGTGLFNMSGADFSEFFKNLNGVAIPGGTLVTRRRDGIRIAKSGERVFGVISTQPGLLGNRIERDEDHDLAKYTPVALTGQIPVRVDETVTQDLIDSYENDGKALFITVGDSGVGTLSLTDTRIEAMLVLSDGLCQCVVR